MLFYDPGGLQGDDSCKGKESISAYCSIRSAEKKVISVSHGGEKLFMLL